MLNPNLSSRMLEFPKTCLFSEGSYLLKVNEILKIIPIWRLPIVTTDKIDKSTKFWCQ